MSCREVVTFWLDMGAPISLLFRVFGAAARVKRRTPRQAAFTVRRPGQVSATIERVMDEQAVREHADSYCAALVAGDIDRAAQELSNELRANLGEVVAMLPMPITTATVESVDRTASGFLLVLHLMGETSETRLETRWKERDHRPVIVEVSHLVETPAAAEPEELTPGGEP